MLENPWIAEQEREDALADEWNEKHNHWDNGRDAVMCDEYMADNDLYPEALAYHLNVDVAGIDADRATDICYSLPKEDRYKIMKNYLDAFKRTYFDQFNEWWEVRFNG